MPEIADTDDSELTMAKCPKCQARKGKRYCPALEQGICSQCCAEHRLETIPCPSDCVHLESEHYQLDKRRQKANSTGKQFVRHTTELFNRQESRDFAFTIQADIYWWMRENGRLENESVAAAMEDLRSRFSAVYVPPRNPWPLSRFLFKLLEKSERHKKLLSANFNTRNVMDAITTLTRHVRSHSRRRGGKPRDEHSYQKELEDYFGQLDFEADLDYSPAEELEEAPRKGLSGYRESSSGLIVPGS